MVIILLEVKSLLWLNSKLVLFGFVVLEVFVNVIVEVKYVIMVIEVVGGVY